MSPEELRAVLDRLQISQMELARTLGVAGQTVRRWVRTDGEVPGPVVVLMRLIDRRPELTDVAGFDVVRHNVA